MIIIIILEPWQQVKSVTNITYESSFQMFLTGPKYMFYLWVILQTCLIGNFQQNKAEESQRIDFSFWLHIQTIWEDYYWIY